jgi:FtsP/CotA-like multicopper oxidase with cupredoxin domain
VTRAIAKSKILALAALLGAATLAGGGPPSQAAAVSVDLCAIAGSVDLPGDTGVPVWGFVPRGVATNCSDAAVLTAPGGPQITVNDGDSVTLTVTNALPGGRSMDFEIPGVTGETTIASGTTGTVTFTAKEGAHLYESSGDAGRQLAMGLYGALIVHSATAGQAYGASGTPYDVEAPLVLSEIDPAFNAAPDTFDMRDYLATYWLINGKAYPDTARINASAGQKVLLRYLNAGYDNTSMTLLGMHQRVIARDGRTLNNPFDVVADTIPAGATEDTIATVPSGGAPSPNGFALYNRNLHVTNGATALNPARGSYSSQGGMMTFIVP